METLRQSALTEVKGEYGNYFDALQKHPRMLVGASVPAIGKEGNETLRDSADAAEWQEAVKVLLGEEVRARAEAMHGELKDDLSIIHGAIDLFQQNSDLVPGTKSFDRALADRFAGMAKPYEVRGEDGKLRGYNIPVQPLIAQLRTQLQAERAAAPKPLAPPTVPAPLPQAGIGTKAGQSGDTEDFSTLFSTLGLTNFRI